MFTENPDIPESEFPVAVLEALLRDRTTGRNIIWATDDYASHGAAYGFQQPITVSAITGLNEGIIKPRSQKAREVQEQRSRDKAEVFTPSWVCNRQNNLVDNEWFGREGVFNRETERGWEATTDKIQFPDTEGRTWRDYVKDIRMEITCGEAPYITSRYDTVTGSPIPPLERIGLLDRKFRVVLENYGPGTEDKKWFKWMKIALESVYGYEWQGDNLLLARENILSSYVRFYMLRFGADNFPPEHILTDVIDVITWNFWQMDGLKCVVPCSCKNEKIQQLDLFGTPQVLAEPCYGCQHDAIHRHNGIQCLIKDWDLEHDGRNKKTIPFHSLIKN